MCSLKVIPSKSVNFKTVAPGSLSPLPLKSQPGEMHQNYNMVLLTSLWCKKHLLQLNTYLLPPSAFTNPRFGGGHSVQ